MSISTDVPTVPEPAGAHHLDGELAATPAAPAQADPELPKPGDYDDRTMAGAIADYALAKLRRYVHGSSEISSHFIELSVRLGELYARLGEAPATPAAVPPQPAADEPSPEEPPTLFAQEEAEAVIEQLPAPEPT